MNQAVRLLSRDRQSSVEAIVSAAGVSRTTFYRAFPSRAELLQALELEPEPDTRQRVLDASIRMLRFHTLKDLSMDELASEADVSRANLYRLFPGKSALFRAILLAYSPFEPVMAVFARAGDVYGLIAAMNGDLPESIAWFEKNRAVPSTGDQKRLQFHLGECGAACPRELTGILTNGRVTLCLKLGLVWRGRSNSRLRITAQTVTRVERDVQPTLALCGPLLHKLRSGYAKAVVGNSERMGAA